MLGYSQKNPYRKLRKKPQSMNERSFAIWKCEKFYVKKIQERKGWIYAV